MKKIVLSLLCFSFSSLVFAESAETGYIKKMYHESVLSNKNSSQSDDNQLLARYSDQKIKTLLKRDNALAKKEGMGCMEYVVLWQGNDLDANAPLTFTQTASNKVKVTIGATEGLEKRSVTYQVDCKTNSCKITEVYENGKPLSQNLKKCLSRQKIN